MKPSYPSCPYVLPKFGSTEPGARDIFKSVLYMSVVVCLDVASVRRVSWAARAMAPVSMARNMCFALDDDAIAAVIVAVNEESEEEGEEEEDAVPSKPVSTYS